MTEGLAPGLFEALTDGLPLSRLWSLLLDVMNARAAERRPANLMEQWEQDRFVQPGVVDQRDAVETDRALLAAAPDFESMELSPVAPLGVCSTLGFASQNKVLSALRGTEVVSDPTNVMALECARRLRQDPRAIVRLTTAHRCLRAQPFPKDRGFTATFRMFCLVSSAIERPNHELLVEATTEHIRVMLDALDALERCGFEFRDRRVTVLATEERATIGDRIAAAAGAQIARARLEHPYYHGLRFQIAARATDGSEIPLIDGGAFDWVAKLISNRRAVFVASALGSQLASTMFRSRNPPLR